VDLVKGAVDISPFFLFLFSFFSFADRDSPFPKSWPPFFPADSVMSGTAVFSPAGSTWACPPPFFWFAVATPKRKDEGVVPPLLSSRMIHLLFFLFFLGRVPGANKPKVEGEALSPPPFSSPVVVGSFPFFFFLFSRQPPSKIEKKTAPLLSPPPLFYGR